MSNIILLSLIGIGVVTSFSFIHSVKNELRIVELSEIKGSEQLKSKILDIKGFHSVSSSDQMKVVLKQGDYHVEVLAESNLLEFISVDNKDGVLTVSRVFEEGKKINHNLPMIVKVTAPTFQSIIGRKQSETLVEGKLTLNELRMSFGDQSDFKGEVEVDNIDLILRQQSNATIYGKTNGFDLELQDQSGLLAGALNAAKVKVSMHDQTNARVSASESISGTVTGNAGLLVDGKPAKSTLEKSKMADIRM